MENHCKSCGCISEDFDYCSETCWQHACEQTAWEEHDALKYEQEMRELDKAVQNGTDIYPDYFY